MSDILKLQEQRVQIKAEATAIEAKAKDEDRVLTVDETTRLEALADQAEAKQEEIQSLAAESASARIQELRDDLETPIPRKTTASTIGRITDRRERDQRHGFESLTEFALAVHAVSAGNGKPPDDRLYLGAAATNMQQKVGADGGFLVPPTFSKTIWDGMNDGVDNLLSLSDNYTVEGESLTFSAKAETSRVTGSRYGGVQGYWMAEADQMSNSTPKVRQLKLEPQDLGVMVHATDKLLRNGQAVEQYLSRAAVDEINFLVGNAIINGTGAGQPLGILTSNAVVQVAKENGQTANTIETENITKMFSRLHARSQPNAIWLINQDIWPQLLTMTVGVGTGGAAVFLPPGQTIANAPYGTLYGRPIILSEYCATLGTVGDILLVDMKGYASGTRGGINSAMSIHLRFDYNETAFRFMFAVDGQPWLQKPITPFKGSNTQSAFVSLATRA